MATKYSEREMKRVLHELHIDPVNGKIEGAEAARILTWRATHEYGVEYTYNATAIRQHVKQNHFPAGSIDTGNRRRSKYPVDIVFGLPIAPLRGRSRRQAVS